MRPANTLSSTEDELFYEPRKPKGSGWWKWALAVILGLSFVYRSTRPVKQLRSHAPPSFYGYSRTWSQAERQHQRHLADAYWQVAVRRIQQSYSANRPLPADPPPQFRIGGSRRSMDTGADAGRAHYWYRLREVWDQREAWNVSYGWNTSWVEETTSSLPQYVPQWVSDIFRRIIIFFDGIEQKISVT